MYFGLTAQSLDRAQAYARARELSALGKQLFFDKSLSASGRMSCATCHDPRYAYGPPPEAPKTQRAIPSLRYLQSLPQFTEHYFDSEQTGDDSVDSGPTGGLTWDGRVDRGRDQARLPLLDPDEMANARSRFESGAVQKIAEALEVFEQDPGEFYPYTSRYDEWLDGKPSLTDRELRGLRLFSDPNKGNCTQCHPAAKGASGTSPQFTDYGFIALGVPRTDDAPSGFLDLGLCGPIRKDLRDRPEYCGRFKTPTLRNVAIRKNFFHNGAVHTLREAVEFYVKRDPAKADLPEKYRPNMETGAPFPERPGDRPRLTDSEIDDIVAFLGTLTDQK